MESFAELENIFLNKKIPNPSIACDALGSGLEHASHAKPNNDNFLFSPFINQIFRYSFKNPISLKYNYIKFNNGLFATKDIPKNVVITFFPAHAIYNKESSMLMNLDEKYDQIIDLISLQSESNSQNNEVCYQKYCCSINDKYSLIGDPKNLENSLLYGHLINDSGGNVFENISFDEIYENKSLLKNKIIKYFTTSEKKVNCIKAIVKNFPVVCIQSTKNIKEGDELLCINGPDFWFCYEYNKSYDEYNEITQSIYSDKIFHSKIKNILYNIAS